MWIGLHLVRSGLISPEQLVCAIEYREAKRPPIGRLAIENRMLTVAECFQVLSRQAIQPESFGRIARELRLLNKRQVADLLLAQADRTPSVSESLVATNAITQKEIDRELAAARFERRLRDDLEAFLVPRTETSQTDLKPESASTADQSASL